MKKEKIVSRLKVIEAISFTPLFDFSVQAIKHHWKYRERDDLEERDRITWVAGYLAGRSTESSNVRESLRGLIEALEQGEK